MDFTVHSSKEIYGDREAHSTWKAWCNSNLYPHNKDIVDIGCGGGIYSRAFAGLGAKSVIGIDNSEQYIRESSRTSSAYTNLSFKVGNATDTGLGVNSADLVFERALIHHLSSDLQSKNILEVKQILRSGGLLVVQDRTFDDIMNDNPDHWIRSTLFKSFPRLLDFERKRRPSGEIYTNLLRKNGFVIRDVISYSEIRKTYNSFDALQKEIFARKGKSILFELDDHEVEVYCRKLKEHVTQGEIKEADQWTIWLATAP